MGQINNMNCFFMHSKDITDLKIKQNQGGTVREGLGDFMV